MEESEKVFRKTLLWETFLLLRKFDIGSWCHENLWYYFALAKKFFFGSLGRVWRNPKTLNCGIVLPWPRKVFFFSSLGRVWRDLKKDLGSPYFGQPFCA